ncbi:hypothetical protein, partial [Burkholderia gladioli]|uniref:hypothetical protein n=1 Tax=Burkholderia gladioli TaxID=28095 RepID=UPI00264CDFB8
GLFQNPDDLAFRESGRLHAKFPVDPAARKFYLEHPLILGGTTAATDAPTRHIKKKKPAFTRAYIPSTAF